MMAIVAALAASSSTAALQPALQPWSFLVGHCWAGPAPGGGGQDRHCFESVYGGRHVRDRHSVTSGGREVYAGETIYSVHGPKVIFTYWNSLGGLGTGNAAFSGGEWQFTGTIHATSSSAEEPMTASWKLVPGGYEVREAAEPPRRFKLSDQ